MKMDRHEFHRIMHPREVGTQRRSALGEEESTGVQRGSLSSGSGLVQLPRGSFIVDNGRHIEADAIFQPPPAYRVPPNQQRNPRPIVLRAVTHPVSQSRSGAYESRECPKRRGENLGHRAFVSLVNALQSEGDSGMPLRRAEYDRSQHRLSDHRVRPLTYYAAHRPHRPSPYSSVITRSLVGRPVRQFQGRSVIADQAQRSNGYRHQASQVVDLVDDTPSESCSDTSGDRSVSAPLAFPLSQPESWRAAGALGAKNWQASRLPALCFSSNGMMQMELQPCRPARLETLPPEERTYEDGISPVDLDSLSIAQGIGMNGPTFLPSMSLRLTPPTTSNVPVEDICNLVSDDDDKVPEPRRHAPASSPQEILCGSETMDASPRDDLSAEEQHQSRVMECLQPLLNAIEIVSMQNDADDLVPVAPENDKPDNQPTGSDAPTVSHSVPDLTQNGPAVRSLNDMTQEMSKSIQQRKQRRPGKRHEESWRTRRPLQKHDAESDESGDEEESTKRTRIASAAEDEETVNPYRKPYRKRSSQRRSLNGIIGESSRSRESPEEEVIWQFLNEGRTSTFTVITSAASRSYPVPHAEDLMTSSPVSEVFDSEESLKTSFAMYPSVDDLKSRSRVESWIQRKSQGQLQQLTDTPSYGQPISSPIVILIMESIKAVDISTPGP